MKKLLLCASLFAVLGSVPCTVQAYTAVDSSEDPPYVKAVKEKNEEDLDSALNGDNDEEEVELTFKEKLAKFNGGDAVLIETRDILKGRVADSEGKVIGEVKDVFVAQGGEVVGITAALGRLSLSGDVFLSTPDMSLEGSTKGYAIGLTGTEVKGIFGEIPKGAPDSQGGKILSAKIFSGKDVKTLKDKDFGEILEILFAEEGTRVEAALMKINYGPVKNAVVAVPMEAIRFSVERGRPSFSIKSEEAAEVLKFAIAQSGK